MKKNITTNFIRCFVAILVIFSHSFSLSQNGLDYLAIYTNKIINFGALAVAILFAISGYYIMKSLDNNGSNNFIKKRVLRLVPSLFVVVILCIVLLGLFFSNISIIKYITNINTYKYLLNVIFIPIHDLPGVFQNNIYGSTVNGALWTMMVQFLCYMYIYFAYLVNLANNENRKKYLLISFMFGILGYFIFNYLNIKILISMIRPFLCFVFGSYLYYSKLSNKKVFIASIIISILCIIINKYITLNIWLIIFMTYIVIWLCKNIKIDINNKYINYILSCTYEMYLIGFPVQQALVSVYGGSMNVYLNFVITIIIVIPLSVIVKFLSNSLTKLLRI